MIKTLILVRHSKAENRYNSANDFERSLTIEGKADSKKMATFLFESGIIPDIILTSSASRAIETAMIFSNVFKTPEKNIKASRKLYYCPAKIIFSQIYDLPETVDCIMIVAHNPGISELASELLAYKSFYMENTQVIILSYDTGQWYKLDEKEPVTFRSLRPPEITL
jgi:phosphohistidine phosphatase